MILCIETATQVCSVALCDREKVVSMRESHEKKSHAALLTVFIAEIFEEQGMKASDLSAVAVSKGPGSYTGLRIGVSTAKGIAYGSGVPLMGIETTLPMFHGMKKAAKAKGDFTDETLFCPMIDARRMEVFYAVYDAAGRRIREITAEIIGERSLSDISQNFKIVLSGDGAEKCLGILKHRNMVFYNDFTVSAKYMLVPANEALVASRFEDVAYFEPFYLKDFIATVPKKNIVL